MPQAVAAVAAAGLTGGAAAAFNAAAMFVVGEVVSSFTKQDAPNEKQKLPGTQLMFRAPDAPREIVYGQTRKSGPILFQATSGDEKEYLHLIIALAAHEVEEIGSAYIDGVPEAELLHTHDPQTTTITWTPQPNQGKGDEVGTQPGVVTVKVAGMSFTGTLPEVADAITASDLGIEARHWKNAYYIGGAGVPPVNYLQLRATSAARERFEVQRPANGPGVYSHVTTISESEPGVQAFAISRHTGATNQPADAALVQAFGQGRKARVALKWETNRSGINLTLQGQHLVGKIEDIRRLIETASFADDIEVREQTDTSLILEHQQPGEPIDFTSSNADFSHEYLDAPLPVWTNAHTLNGIAYVHIRFARRSEIWGNNVPQVAFDIKGKNNITDVRSNTLGYTDNWALCVRDYLINYMQVPAGRIDVAETALAATICDERVELDATGKTQPRYTLNGTITEAEKPGDVLAAMAQHGGWIIRRRGIWQPLAFAAQAPAQELTVQDIVGLPTVALGHDSNGLFNAVQGTWSGADSEYNETPAPLVTSPLYKSQDNGKTIPTDIRFRFADGSERAQRLGKIALERHRQQITVQLKAKAHRLDCDVGAVVPVTIAEYGWDNKLFFIADARSETPTESDISANAATTGGTRALVLREYADGMFDWNHGEATLIDLAPNTTLDPSRYIEAPREFEVSTSPAWYMNHSNNLELAVFNATWRAPVGSNISHYRVQWRTAILPEWRSIADTRDSSAMHGPIPDNSTIDVRVKAVAPGGRSSGWVTVSDIPVTSVATLTGGDGAVNVTKAATAPENPDTNDIWLQTSPSGAIVAKYYWDNTKWSDISGSAIATAIANSFEAKDLADGAARLFVFPSTVNPKPVASGTGDLWVQTDTKRIMMWDGSKYVLSSSMDWDDIFGSKKPDDLASADGTYLVDTTFAKLRSGLDTWQLENDAALIGGGVDGSVIRFRHASASSPVPAIISKAATAVPGNRYMTCTARVKASQGMTIKLIAVNDEGQRLNIVQTAGLPASDNAGAQWRTVSVDIAVDLQGHHRFVFELSASIFSYYVNEEWQVDSIDFSPQRRVPGDSGSDYAGWINTLRAANALMPFGWPVPGTDFMAANTPYALHAARSMLHSKVAGSTARFRVRYDVSQHTTSGTITDPINPTLTASVQGRNAAGAWVPAGTEGATQIEATPPIWLPTTIERTFDIKLSPDIVDECEFRIVFESDIVALVRVSEFTVAFWT